TKMTDLMYLYLNDMLQVSSSPATYSGETASGGIGADLRRASRWPIDRSHRGRPGQGLSGSDGLAEHNRRSPDQRSQRSGSIRRSVRDVSLVLISVGIHSGLRCAQPPELRRPSPRAHGRLDDPMTPS